MLRVISRLLLLAFLVTGFTCELTAQRSLGVIWEIPDSRPEAVGQLETFRETGVTFLEISDQPDEAVWSAIDTLGFSVFVQVPVRFPVVETFAYPDTGLIATYQRYLAVFANRDIDGFGIFEYGQTTSRSFPDVVLPFITQIRNALDVPVYIKDWSLEAQPFDTLIDFKMVNVDVGESFEELTDSIFAGRSAFIYDPEGNSATSPELLKQFFTKSGTNEEAILWFDSEWLLEFLDRYPGLQKRIHALATEKNAVFPVPESKRAPSHPYSLVVIVLLLLWGTFAIHYKLEPMYRKSLFRYFFSHKFFVQDVLQRHIRSVGPGIVLLLQHAVMGGLFLYVLTAVFFTDEGLQVLNHHYPVTNLFGFGKASIFLIGIFITLLFEIACVIWIYLANRKVTFMSQIVILYSWSLQANLIVITLLVTLLLSGGALFITYFLFLLFAAVALSAFPLTAFDTGQVLADRKPLFMIATVGLHLLALGGIAYWISFNSYFVNVVRLSASIY